MSRTVVNQELNEQEIRVNRENILIGGGAVNSVNGQTGDVVLTAQDVGAASTTELGSEVDARIAADNGLQSQIDGLAAASDVTDIVGTYADLQAYDTSKLSNNDIIKVLQDEQHDDETTYYRWSTDTESFTLIGEEGPYYTKSAADTKFQDKLVAGTNITIDPSTNEISASASGLSDSTTFWGRTASNGKVGGKLDVKYSENDTSYVTITPTNTHSMSITQTSGGSTHTLINFGASNAPATFYEGINANNKKITNVATPTDTTDAANKDYVDSLIPSDFTGTDGVDAGTHGLVPAPTAADVGKFLKGDGTWGEAGGGGGSGSDGVYHFKLSEMLTTTLAGTTYYALPNGIDDLHTGLYIFENDTNENIPSNQIAGRIQVFLQQSGYGNMGTIFPVYGMGAMNLNSGHALAVMLQVYYYNKSGTTERVAYTSTSFANYTSSTTMTGGTMWVQIVTSNGAFSSQSFYSWTAPMAVVNNLTTADQSANAGIALAAAQGGVLNRKILGVSSGTSAASWTTIGASSKYTKRALQIILNVKETGLTLTANDWNTLFTMSSGWRPTVEMIVGCTILDNGAYASSILKVTTDGEVKVMAGSNTTEVYGLLTIPVAS